MIVHFEYSVQGSTEDYMQDMKNILIIRPSSIGDIVMASPMIKVLRDGYPGGRIAWLADPGTMDLLRFHPGLDEVIPWDKTGWETLWRQGRVISLIREIIRFSTSMRSMRFDLALDAQGLLRSRFLARLSGARERLGFESREPGRFLMTRIISRGPNNGHMGSEYYFMMEALGFFPGPFLSGLTLSPGDRVKGEQAIRQAGVVGEYATICPFTTRVQKHWLKDRWAMLAKRIRRLFSVPVIILGGPEDVQESALIRTLASGEVFDLTGKMTLAQSAAVISRSSLVVGVDTGLTHMAVDFGRPTIALFGATCPYLHSGNPRAYILYKRLACSPCRRSPVCEGAYTCMKSIQVKDVLDAAQSVLKGS